MTHTILGASAALLCLTSLSSTASAGGGVNGLTERVLFLPGGQQIQMACEVSDLSSDGRYAVVDTYEGLLPADVNGQRDVYVIDIETGALQLASVSAVGTLGNDMSWFGRVSDDGRYVVFETQASNLVGLDFNGASDVLRKDLQTGQLVRVSAPIGSAVAADGHSGAPDISADGRYVVFLSRASDLDAGTQPNRANIYRRDMQAQVLVRLSKGVFGEPDGDSYHPTVSADGSRVAYMSWADNLVLHDVNDAADIFVQTPPGNPVLVSKGPGGVLADDNSSSARLSRDGLHVAFTSSATNLVDGDWNDDLDTFVTTIGSGVVELVSARPDSTSASGSSLVRDLSDDGRFVLFDSGALDLTADGTTVVALYLRDRQTESTALVSRPGGAATLPNSVSYVGHLSGDAASAVFVSAASNLIPGDTNGVMDLFERTFLADPVTYCISSTTSAGCTPQIASSGIPSASADSGFAVSASDLPNNKVGILFYSLQGSAQIPFLGGALCTGPLAGRSPALLSGGNPSISDCSGAFTIDMNAFAAGLFGGLPHAALSLIGQQVNAQFWGRDPEGAVHTSFLSNALEYFVGP
jgi:hypothetical protein